MCLVSLKKTSFSTLKIYLIYSVMIRKVKYWKSGNVDFKCFSIRAYFMETLYVMGAVCMYLWPGSF